MQYLKCILGVPLTFKLHAYEERVNNLKKKKQPTKLETSRAALHCAPEFDKRKIKKITKAKQY